MVSKILAIILGFVATRIAARVISAQFGRHRSAAVNLHCPHKAEVEIKGMNSLEAAAIRERLSKEGEEERVRGKDENPFAPMERDDLLALEALGRKAARRRLEERAQAASEEGDRQVRPSMPHGNPAYRKRPAQRATPGTILWNPPDRMKVGRREMIEVRLADATVVEAALREGLRGRGTPNVDKLEIAPLMRVALVGDAENFSIQELSTKDQHVQPGQVARWDFGVTPQRAGIRLLRLLASMRVKVEGKDEVVDLPSYEREVRVAVAPVRAAGRFLGNNWKWVAGTVAIPVAIWAAKGLKLNEAIFDPIRAMLGHG